MDVTSTVGSTNMPYVEATSTIDRPKHSNLLCLPVETRLQVYAELFGTGKIVLDGGNHQKLSCYVSRTAAPITAAESRSSQLLQTCKTILYEARPVLYANTVFHVIQHTFAGSFAIVECDVLKRWYEDDLRFHRAADWAGLSTLEIRCRVDAWRGSYCGDIDDRADFATGRDQVLAYGARLLGSMNAGDIKTFHRLVEDRRLHGKGEMRIRLTRTCEPLCSDDELIEELQS